MNVDALHFSTETEKGRIFRTPQIGKLSCQHIDNLAWLCLTWLVILLLRQ